MNNLLSVNQVAFILKVHPLSVRRYIKENKLKEVKVGGNIRVQENDLQDFNRAVEPSQVKKTFYSQTKKIIPDKRFSAEDPFLRLQGRGASLRLS